TGAFTAYRGNIRLLRKICILPNGASGEACPRGWIRRFAAHPAGALQSGRPARDIRRACRTSDLCLRRATLYPAELRAPVRLVGVTSGYPSNSASFLPGPLARPAREDGFAAS